MNKFLNDNIYVLGGCGLLGDNLINQLSVFEKVKIIVLDKEKKEAKKNVFYEKIDLTNLKFIKKKLKLIFKKHGTPTKMVNCSYPKTIDWKKNNYSEINLKTYEKNISIHLNSFVWNAKIFADEMYRKKISDASIVQVSSIYGFLGQNRNLYKNENFRESMSYAVIKGGIINSVRSMASYYGHYNIRVNSVSPGGVFDNQSKTFVKKYSKMVPLRRMSKSNEISSSIIFLLSNSSSYITGSNLIIDGGYSII